jgi:hypothetical protein
MKHLLLLPLFFCLTVAPAIALDAPESFFDEEDELVISAIVEAQYAACKGGNAAFKNKVLKNVRKACVGKSSCRLVSSAAAEDLGCKKLYVKVTCSDDSEREFVRKAAGIMSFNCD